MALEQKKGRISIHVPRVGDDAIVQAKAEQCIHISIHVPRVGDDKTARGASPQRFISIHVPRVGDDSDNFQLSANGEVFLSTSPAWGTTLNISVDYVTLQAFLSTSPAWGTTIFSGIFSPQFQNFYPRPPRGGRPILSCCAVKIRD